MIKIGNEKLFSQTELLENLAAYLANAGYTDFEIRNNRCNFEISAVASIIGESADFVRGFVTSRRKG